MNKITNQRLNRRWRFCVNELNKEKAKIPIETKILAEEITDLATFYKIVGKYQLTYLPYYFETRLELYDFDHSSEHDITRVSIVNFPIEKSAELYIQLTLDLITQKMNLNAEIESISLIRKSNNFSLTIDISGYNPNKNPSLINLFNTFCQRFRSIKDAPEYTIELSSIIVGKSADISNALSFKNTVDSVKHLISKR